MIQTETMYEKPMINNDRNKKPLISPVRNPFKANIQKQIGFNQKKNNQNFFDNPTNAHQTYQSNLNANYLTQEQKLAGSSQSCTNHNNKTAEYISYIEDNQILYCGKCAAQLASQGF